MSKVYAQFHLLLACKLRTPLFAAMLMFLLPGALSAQFNVICPGNAVIYNDSGSCGAFFGYSITSSGGLPIVDSFSYTGGPQFWVAPAACQVAIEVWGAQGNTNALGVVGGLGGYATGSFNVASGETLHVFVGGGATTSVTGGYNGGGDAGAVGCASAFAGGGGGASDIRAGGTGLANRIIVGGGGGGAAGNRVTGCGRGTGGGGGGGYYGGGGGAAWPYTSVVVPTGGTQAAGGAAGTSAWTTVPNNNGFAGVVGVGGKGGDEATSSQGTPAQIATSGGTGGGTTGGIGSYAGNFAGQSGAGGSGYIGGVTSGSMTSGTRTGAGKVRLTYFIPDSIILLSGLPSGSLFPLGTTTNLVEGESGGNLDSCSFTVTVIDNTAPTTNCPGMDTLMLDSGCVAMTPDYQSTVNATDVCSGILSETQTPAAGSLLSGVGSLQTFTYYCSDSAGNTDTCTWMALLWDATTPSSGNCPTNGVTFTPTTLDCNPVVTFTTPIFTDNCGPSPIDSSSHASGDNFPVGTTVVTYYSSDSAGNMGICTFNVVVNMPTLGVITVMPPAPCAGGSTTLTAPGGFTHHWSNNAISQSITVTTTGIYWVDVTDSAGCTGRDSVTITFSSPSPVITPNGAQLCTGNFSSYQWLLNGSPIPGANGLCYQPTTNGAYSVTVTDSNGCSGTSAPLTFVGVHEGFDVGFEMFPNPAQNQLNIRLLQPLNEAGQIRVYDLSGRVVIARAFTQLQGTTTLDLSNLSAGSYIVEIAGADFRGQRKLTHIQ